MAAALHPECELCDLRALSASDLNPLLEEESAVWLETLDWDFARSADLVRKFTDLRALNGAALVSRSGVVGYAYYVLEDHKGLIGDLYVRKQHRTPENEYRLLSSVVKSIAETQYVRRIESQLILFGSQSRSLPRPSQVHVYEREFLEIDLDVAAALPAAQQTRIHIEPWAAHHQEGAAHLIAGAYVGHVDSQINDQYRSLSGARRFLHNIVQYPGCGVFSEPASLVAFEKGTGWMCGLSLASIVGPQVGHITQVCLAPDVRGAHLGYEMVRQSLRILQLNGCTQASLTVTRSNVEALKLYRSLGFRSLRRFPAFVWEGF